MQLLSVTLSKTCFYCSTGTLLHTYSVVQCLCQERKQGQQCFEHALVWGRLAMLYCVIMVGKQINKAEGVFMSTMHSHVHKSTLCQKQYSAKWRHLWETRWLRVVDRWYISCVLSLHGSLAASSNTEKRWTQVISCFSSARYIHTLDFWAADSSEPSWLLHVLSHLCKLFMPYLQSHDADIP